MKRIKFKVLAAIMVLIAIIAACQSSQKPPLSKADSLKIAAEVKKAALTKLFNLKSPLTLIVCNDYAKACTTLYQTTYKTPANNMVNIAKAYTTSLRYPVDDLTAWIEDIRDNSNATEIRICFGVYTPEIVAAYPEYLTGKDGRLTAFIYAFNGTNPAKYISASTYPGPIPASTADCLHLKNRHLTGGGNIGDDVPPYDLAGLDP